MVAVRSNLARSGAIVTPSKTLYQEQPKNIVNVVTQTLRRLQFIRVNRLLQGAWRDAWMNWSPRDKLGDEPGMFCRTFGRF
jgi:hypothetical protein